MTATQRRAAYLGDIGAAVLAELAEDPPAVREALGLGTAATRGVGASSGSVAAGDDARLGVDPDTFTGTDFAKVQAAIIYAIANNFPAVNFRREFDITGQGPLIIEKTPWHDRRVLWLLGQGGGIKKTDAGAMFTAPVRSTGDISVRNMRFLSTSGAGTVVFDCDKLIRISSIGNDYRGIDRIAQATGDTIAERIQSLAFIGDHIISGTGHAFRAALTYDLTIAYCLVEDRAGGLFTNGADAATAQNYALKIIGNVVENCIGTAPDGAPIKVACSNVATIDGNYFEANHVNAAVPDIDLHTLCGTAPQRAVRVQNNIHSRSTFQNSSGTAAIWVGRTSTPIVSAANVAFGILYDMKPAAGVTTALGSIIALGGDYSTLGRIHLRAFHNASYASPSINAAPPSGNTAARPVTPRLYQTYFDTTLGKPIWCLTAGTRAQQSITISAGASSSGNITVTLNDTGPITVAVAAGDTIEQVVDKIVATTFIGWTTQKYLVTRVLFTRDNLVAAGALPTFSGGSTGVTQSAITLDVNMAAATWCDATGATV
jgi:hypothetical protein